MYNVEITYVAIPPVDFGKIKRGTLLLEEIHLLPEQLKTSTRIMEYLKMTVTINEDIPAGYEIAITDLKVRKYYRIRYIVSPNADLGNRIYYGHLDIPSQNLPDINNLPIVRDEVGKAVGIDASYIGIVDIE